MLVEGPVRDSGDQQFGLIETLRFQPREGCIRIDRHIDRMARSARHFDRRFDEAMARRLLGEVDGEMPLRLRLFLDENDALSLTTHPFVPISAGTVWRVAIARNVQLDPGDPVLRHKTSLRAHYDAARGEFPTGEVDEVLLINTHGRVCEGSITSLFLERDGTLLTPPLSDGLLAGVLRAELLDTGRAKEHRLLPPDLKTGALYVGNSLRGLIPARLIEP